MKNLHISVLFSALLSITSFSVEAVASDTCGKPALKPLVAEEEVQYTSDVSLYMLSGLMFQPEAVECTTLHFLHQSLAERNTTGFSDFGTYTEASKMFSVGTLDISKLPKLKINTDFSVSVLGREAWRPYIKVDLRRLVFAASGTEMYSRIGVAYSLDLYENITWTADGAANIANLVGRKSDVAWRVQTAMNVEAFESLILSPTITVRDSASFDTELFVNVGISFSF